MHRDYKNIIDGALDKYPEDAPYAVEFAVEQTLLRVQRFFNTRADIGDSGGHSQTAILMRVMGSIVVRDFYAKDTLEVD